MLRASEGVAQGCLCGIVIVVCVLLLACFSGVGGSPSPHPNGSVVSTVLAVLERIHQDELPCLTVVGVDFSILQHVLHLYAYQFFYGHRGPTR